MKTKVGEWLEVARIDRKSYERLSTDAELTPAAAFHVHQCVEKLFKAILESKDLPIPKIHDLDRLHALVKDSLTISCDEDVLDDLSRLYIDTRYPSMHGFMPYGKPTLSDIQRYADFASRLYDHIVPMLSD